MEHAVKLIQEQLCPNYSREHIKDVLCMVREQNPTVPPEQLVDLAVNIIINEQSYNNSPSSVTPPNSEEALWEIELNGAVGFGRSNLFSCSANELLMRTFPEADEDFVREYCEREGSHFDLDKAIDKFSTEGYRRNVSRFNNAAFLKKDTEKLVGQVPTNNNDSQNFLTQIKENPTFHFEQFLEMFPDPERFFGDPNKKNPLESPEVCQEDIDYALTFLYNKYSKIRKRHIRQVFERMQKRLYNCCLYLNKFPSEMRQERPEETSSRSRNADLLLEVTYLTHRRFLIYHLKYRNQSYEKKRT